MTWSDWACSLAVWKVQAHIAHIVIIVSLKENGDLIILIIIGKSCVTEYSTEYSN